MTLLRLFGIRAGLECGADDHDVPGHDRRGVEADFGAGDVEVLIEPELQIDDAVLAEARHGIAGLRVQRDETVARRHVEDPLVFLSVAPVREAAARQLPRRRRTARAFVLAVHPQQLAGRGVERRRRRAACRRSNTACR